MSDADKEGLSDSELLRYSRQIMLPSFDIAGQLRLANSTVLVIGLGGLGSPAALYLAAAGVSRLILVDHDVVDLSNLQRQIAHTEQRVDQSKVSSAASAIKQLNSTTQVEVVDSKLSGEQLDKWVELADLVLDCTDNFGSRFEINRACHARKIPLVSGAAIRMEGQVSTFDFSLEESPCYQCLYSDLSAQELSCSESGVMAPLVGVIGSMQAMEAIKILSGVGTSLVGRLLIFDAMNMEWRKLKLNKDPACSCCS